MFTSGLAFIQNWADLPKGIPLRENSPEEIMALTEEALEAGEGEDERVAEARAAYCRIAAQNHSYAGSTLAASFVRAHVELFGLLPSAAGSKGERPSGPTPDAMPSEVHAEQAP